jgi:hypothetical protein
MTVKEKLEALWTRREELQEKASRAKNVDQEQAVAHELWMVEVQIARMNRKDVTNDREN